MAAWGDACALEGTCPECGLRFEWADVFDPWRSRSPWLFEHKRRGSLGVVRAVRSWWRAVWPARFWRGVRITYACPRSVLWWPLVLILSWQVPWSVARTGYEFWRGPAVSSGKTVRLANGLLQAVPPTPWQVVRQRLADAWIDPWYPVYVARFDPHRVTEVMLESYAPAAAVCAASLVTGLTFLSLTRSRRLSGVRASHVLRAMVYRLAPLGVLQIVWMADQVQQRVPGAYRLDAFIRHFWYVPLLLCAAWGVWWWRCAFRIGWKIPDARLATALLGAVDVLTFVVVFCFISPFGAGRLLI